MELQDHFLIAMPQLDDSYFQDTLIYLCEHNDKGSMGLVLNQPTDLSITELVAKLNFMRSDGRHYPDQYVLAGGPVHIDRGFILHTPTAQSFLHSYKLNDRLQMTTSADVIDTFGTAHAPEKYLVALGCASWVPNQLEREIAENSWLVVPAKDEILFDTDPLERLSAAQQLLGFPFEKLSAMAGSC